ncbi:MAG: RDD family protein, partial [Shewanella sp.]
LINPDKLALQDSMTRSEVVVLSKEANQMRNWHGA